MVCRDLDRARVESGQHHFALTGGGKLRSAQRQGRPQRESKDGNSAPDSAAPTTREREKQGLPCVATGAESTGVSQRADLDAELRALAKRYIDAGQIARAMALLATLEGGAGAAADEEGKHGTSPGDKVVSIDAARGRRGR